MHAVWWTGECKRSREAALLQVPRTILFHEMAFALLLYICGRMPFLVWGIVRTPLSCIEFELYRYVIV